MKDNTRSSSDKELIRRMRRGDTDALEEWFGLNADGLYAFIYFRVGKNADLASEITQETFANALEQLNKFDPDRGPMLSWLCTLSRNCIRKTLRDNGRNVSIALWDAIDQSLHRVYEQIDDGLIAPDLLEAKETRELVSLVLTQLPPDYREILEAKYMKELSLQDIAASQGRSVDSVKGRIKRARVAFRQTFATLAGTTPHLERPGGVS